MKWNDLTKEQQEFLLELDREYPMPEGATHFDIRDIFDTSWMQLDEENGVYLTATNGRRYCAVDDIEALRDFMPIPDKPWYDPEDVSLNKPDATCNKEPSGSSNSYYWIEIPLDRVKIDEEKGVVGFMLEQYLKYGLGNDFDRCNLAKANHRIGKKGNSKDYEIGKMHYYVDQIDKNFEEDV